MKLLLRSVRAAALCAALAIPVAAGATDSQKQIDDHALAPGSYERALLTAVAAWVSANFNLPQSGDHPHIASTEVVHGYDRLTRTIYLPDQWKGDTPSELSILVHEVAHHLQYQAGLRFNCPQEREAIPYAAQERWLNMSKRDLASEFGITSDILFVSTQCIP